VRLLFILVVLAACQRSTPDDCERVVTHVIDVKKSVNKIPTPESQWDDWRKQMLVECRAKFSATDRTCLLAIKTMEDLGNCMASVKGTAPARTPGQ